MTRGLTLVLVVCAPLVLTGCLFEEGTCPGPPLAATTYVNDAQIELFGLPVDDAIRTTVSPSRTTVQIAFTSAGRPVELRFRVSEVDEHHERY